MHVFRQHSSVAGGCPYEERTAHSPEVIKQENQRFVAQICMPQLAGFEYRKQHHRCHDNRQYNQPYVVLVSKGMQPAAQKKHIVGNIRQRPVASFLVQLRVSINGNEPFVYCLEPTFPVLASKASIIRNCSLSASYSSHVEPSHRLGAPGTAISMLSHRTLHVASAVPS